MAEPQSTCLGAQHKAQAVLLVHTHHECQDHLADRLAWAQAAWAQVAMPTTGSKLLPGLYPRSTQTASAMPEASRRLANFRIRQATLCAVEVAAVSVRLGAVMMTLGVAGSRRCLSGSKHPSALTRSLNRSRVGLGCAGLRRRHITRLHRMHTTQKWLPPAVRPADVLLDVHRAAPHPLSSADAIHGSVAGLVPCEGVPQCQQHNGQWRSDRGLPSCGALHVLVEMGSLPPGCLAWSCVPKHRLRPSR